jgi:tetratricopeptide (TPR) repeat protein
MIRTTALLSILLTATVAFAQNPPPSGGDKPPDGQAATEAEQRERAKPFYIDARRQHENKEYLAAAENYLAAHREYPKAAFIYNAAQVYRLGGELEKALEHYKKYVELEPDGEGAKFAGEFIAAIEKKLAEPRPPAISDPKDPKDPGDPKGPGDEVDTDLGDASGELGGLGHSEPIPVVSKSMVAAEGQNKRLAGLALTGAGVVLVGVGVGFGLHARSLDNEASEFMGSFEDLEDLYDRGETADRNMVIFLSAGAVTAAAGGLLYYLGSRDRSRAERDLEIFASPTRGGGMVGLAISH